MELSKQRTLYAMVAIGWDRIAIVGGIVVGTETKQWSTYEMKEGRVGCAAVAIKEKIYVFGGYKLGVGRLSSCECLDLSVDNGTSESVSIPSMSEARVYSAAVVYEKTKMIVLGGWNGSR